MDYLTAMGVDPGLVHTGVVTLTLDRGRREFFTDHRVLDGVGPVALSELEDLRAGWLPHKGASFVEAYRPRSAYDSDARMGKAVSDIAARGFLPINNTGVKKVVRRELLEALGLWNFTTATHHGDLRSAAYIMLYGMLKDPRMNEYLAQFATDYLIHAPWTQR